MTVVNLTSHEVTVFDGDVAVAQWPPEGVVARVREIITSGQELDTEKGSVPTCVITYANEVDGLPTPQSGVTLLVSRITAARVCRPDVYFPVDEVRSPTGQVIGCRRLGQFLTGSHAHA